MAATKLATIPEMKPMVGGDTCTARTAALPSAVALPLLFPGGKWPTSEQKVEICRMLDTMTLNPVQPCPFPRLPDMPQPEAWNPQRPSDIPEDKQTWWNGQMMNEREVWKIVHPKWRDDIQCQIPSFVQQLEDITDAYRTEHDYDEDGVDSDQVDADSEIFVRTHFPKMINQYQQWANEPGLTDAVKDRRRNYVSRSLSN